jgi:hypothetical protein
LDWSESRGKENYLVIIYRKIEEGRGEGGGRERKKVGN